MSSCSKSRAGEWFTAGSSILTATSLSAVGTDKSAFDCSRVSLPGAQEKTALLKRDGVWQRPLGATPTTHILKLPMGTNAQQINLSTSIENEWLCARIVREFNIPVASCAIETFRDQKALVVERFDRRPSDDGQWLIRLPQEDFCQATGTAAALKYESDGGPGIDTIMKLLNRSENHQKDRYDFMKTQLVFWLLAAIDGHSKNFSIFLHPGSGYRLTPRYDILSAYPVLGHGAGLLSPHKIRMAMAVTGKNRHYRWKEITARHWLETAMRCGFDEMNRVMEEVVETTPGAIDRATNDLPREFPEALAHAITAGTIDAAKRMEKQLSERS